ncbi:MAG TPA: hypothetical protein PKK60_02480 [archaeon]|nr:hypothetical protein [archaeon]
MKKFFSKVSFSKKGFIGPIGDDLPSLIPIVMSLLLFFTIFAVTLNTYNTKNNSISKQTMMISSSRELKGDSIILGIDSFNDRCDKLKLKNYPYNFMAVIYPTAGQTTNPLENLIDEFINIDFDSSDNLDVGTVSSNVITDNSVPFVCGYKKRASGEFKSTTKTYYLRYYPVAVQTLLNISGSDYYVIVPGVMTMVVWE